MSNVTEVPVMDATACQLPGCLFVDVDTLPSGAYGMVQLLFLMMCYGYVLFNGANMIGDGAEMLLDLPAWAPTVGPIVLPVLGAVPDAAIVFFSGLGPGAQTQLAVGIGALAGSTVMLLTVPWALSIYGGLVCYEAASKVEGVKAAYELSSKKKKMDANKTNAAYGVAPDPKKLIKSAWIMVVTLISYVVIQFPAMPLSTDKTVEPVPGESMWSLIGLITSCVFFVGNLAIQYVEGASDEGVMLKVKMANRKAKLAGKLGVTAAFGKDARGLAAAALELDQNKGTKDHIGRWMSEEKPVVSGVENDAFRSKYKNVIKGKGLDGEHKKEYHGNKHVFAALLELFVKYDTDNSGDIGPTELKLLLANDLGAGMSVNIDKIIAEYQLGAKDESISFWEFVALFIDLGGRDHYLTQRYKRATKFEKEQYDAIVQSNGLENWTNPFFLDEPKRVPALLKQCIEITKADKTFNEEQQKEISSRISRDMDCEQLSDGDDDDDEEEEEEEEEVYMVHEHNSNLLTESFYMMGVGTVLVLLFSDPMVDCLGDLATRTGIPTFYVSFLLAPLASNASELLSSMKMAEKKDEESITAAMQQCLGACIMNNTLGLFTFMALIYFQGLEWEYSSETVCTVIPQLAIVPFTYLSVHNMTAAYMVASLYPICLILFMVFEYGLGWN